MPRIHRKIEDDLNEKRFKSLEKERKAALEMAKKEDAQAKASTKNAQVGPQRIKREHRVVRHPRGLQLSCESIFHRLILKSVNGNDYKRVF